MRKTGYKSYNFGAIDELEEKIKAVDGMPGSGKSSAIFDYMKHHKGSKRFIFVTPYLTESEDRIKALAVEGVNLELEIPKLKNGKGKQSHIIELLKAGKNISTTHAMMKQFRPEVFDLIREKGYVIVIDESIDLIEQYEQLSDFSFDLIKHAVEVEPRTGLISWKQGKAPESSYFDNCKADVLYNVCLAISNQSLYESKGRVFWLLSPELIRCAQSVIILTHRFESSFMCAWLKLLRFGYEYVDTQKLGLRSERELERLMLENLQLVPATGHLLECGERGLSLRWYDRQSETQLRKLKKSIEHNVKEQLGASYDSIIWTCFSNYEKHLAGSRYSKKVGDLKSFVAMNIKATNRYADRQHALFLCNTYANVGCKLFFESKRIHFDEASYALSLLLQFLYRGCIRNAQPMQLMVPSVKMLELLKDYLALCRVRVYEAGLASSIRSSEEIYINL